MKKLIQRAIFAAFAVSLTSVIPVSAVEPSPALPIDVPELSNQIAFQIPMNTYCSMDNALDFSFQLANASDTPADITFYLYQKDGSAYNEEGTAYGEIESTLLPGKPVTLRGNQTGLYHLNFGNHKKCSERVYLGKIVANSAEVSLLARGWVDTKTGGNVLGTQTINVNDGKVFDLAASVFKK
jgi:hypothetical protein